MIQNFTNYLKNIRGLSDNTCRSYAKDLRDFAKWMKAHREDARWSNITRDDLDAYVTEQAERGLKPATTNRRLASIGALYTYFKREGLTDTNPARYEGRRKEGERIPNTIPERDLQEAYENAQGVAKTMLGLLITTGIRIQELLDLCYEDIDFDEQSIRIKGKGNKEREVYTTSIVLATLETLHRDFGKTGRIFTIEQREARYIIWNALKNHSNARQLSPHAIRHTFATNLAKNGCNASSIAAHLGHANIETTQRYIDLRQHNRREEAQHFSII